MRDIREFYILGLPIQTEIGECNFLKVSDYPDYIVDLLTVSMSKENLIFKYTDMNKDGSLNEFIDELHKLDLFTISAHIPEMQVAYYNLFNKVFENEEAIKLVTPENFEYYRNLILTMNYTKEEKINPNPEIQKAIERSRKLKAKDNEGMEFADIVSSIVGYNGLTYDDINKFTIYQLYMTFYRINQIKNYDTSSLFATVSDKVKIDSWNKHINLFEEDSHSLSREEFEGKRSLVES